MTKSNEIYKCNICGNIVEVLHTGVGELVCCGQPMQLQNPNTVDAAIEKHVPVVEKAIEGVVIHVGATEHPMLPEHYIEWVEAICSNGKIVRKHFSAGDKPELRLPNAETTDLKVRAYCNIHGLWSN